MNIGEIRKNANGQLIGSVETLTITRTIGLRPVTSSNPRAPKYEIVALNDQRRWVIVGALFELSSNSTGESFYQGKIDDPSMAQPLYIAAFPREDGTMAVAWQRPRRRSSQLGSAEYGESDMFGADDVAATTAPASRPAKPPRRWPGRQHRDPSGQARPRAGQGRRRTRWRAAAARRRLIVQPLH
jgi:uncharacterized protein (DUF736 family)